VNVPKNQFAPVANLPVYERLHQAGLLGDYHLLIATEVVKDPEKWNEFWMFASDRGTDQAPFIIMDNGLIETGKPTSLRNLDIAADAVQANCIVLPDALADFRTTMKLVAGSIHEYKRLKYPLMGVVQGQTVEEVTTLIQYYVDQGVEYLSIPRVMVGVFGTRRWLVEKARWTGLPIHLLGFSDNLDDDMQCAAMEGVMGIDSATPIWYGLAPYREYFPAKPPRQANLPKRPKDYWSIVPDPMFGDFDIVAKNITKVRNWIARSVPTAPQAE
jgi:hypothetical protein